MATRERKIEIAVDSQQIAGTIIRPGTLVPGVLLVHGWGGVSSSICRAHARSRRWAAFA